MYLVRINAVDESASKDLFVPIVGELVYGSCGFRHAQVKIPSLFGEQLFDTNWWANDPVSGPVPMDCFVYDSTDQAETIRIVSAIMAEKRLIVHILPKTKEELSWAPKAPNVVIYL